MNESSAPSFTIGIVAHEKRLEHAERLSALVGANYMSVDDRTKRLGCDKNHKTVWNWHRHNTTTQWAVVLEDDAVPIDDFTQQLEQALAASPEPIISLYLGQQRPDYWQPHIHTATTQATTQGAHWITTNAAIHAVAIAIQTHLIPDLLNHWRDHLPSDQATSSWTRRTNRTIAYTWPSLVDHLDEPTIIKRRQDGMPRTPGRIAWQVGSHDEWNSESLSMPNPLDTPRHQRQRTA